MSIFSVFFSRSRISRIPLDDSSISRRAAILLACDNFVIDPRAYQNVGHRRSRKKDRSVTYLHFLAADLLLCTLIPFSSFSRIKFFPYYSGDVFAFLSTVDRAYFNLLSPTFELNFSANFSLGEILNNGQWRGY